MPRYSEERKAAVLRKLLPEPPCFISISIRSGFNAAGPMGSSCEFVLTNVLDSLP